MCRFGVTLSPPMQIGIRKLILYTAAYLLLPHLIFLLGWISMPIAIVATAIILLAGFKISKTTLADARVEESILITPNTFKLLVALSLGLVVFAGIGGFLWQRDDFFKHNLIFYDLIGQSWPVQYGSGEGSTMLTYYLGWYMVPAAMGKLGGVWAAELANVLWSATGLLLFFLWLSTLLKKQKALLWLVFLGISGFEFLWVLGHFAYYVIKFFPQYDLITLLKGTLGYTRSELITPFLNQNIPSFFVAFLSAPQHVIAGFLVSAAVIYGIVNKLLARYTVLLASLTVFWSPLVCIGLLPFVLYHLWQDKAQLRKAENLWIVTLSAVVLFFVLSYLASHSPLTDKGFVWQLYIKNWLFYTLVFIALKFGLIFLYLWYKNKQLDFMGDYKTLSYISAIGLAMLSFYKLGAYNDLIARASIPFYFVMLLLCVFFLQKISTQKIKEYSIVWLVVALMLLPRLWQVYKTAAYTPQMATKKYTLADVPTGYSINDHNYWLLIVKPEYSNDYLIYDGISGQYLGNPQSFFYVYLAKK